MTTLGVITGINSNASSEYRPSANYSATWVRINHTIKLGWDFGAYTRERHGRSAVFSPAVANPSAGGHPGGSIYEATCGCRFARNYPYVVGPRAGLAYQINRKTVLRAGFGIVYNATPIAIGTTYSGASSGQLGFGQWLFQLKDGRPDSMTPQWPDFRVNAGHPDNAVLAPNPAAVDLNSGRPARQYQWSVGLQREISPNLVVEASYVANRGVWWAAPGLSQLNVLSQAALNAYGLQVGNEADGALLNAQINLLSAAQRSARARKASASSCRGL